MRSFSAGKMSLLVSVVAGPELSVQPATVMSSTSASAKRITRIRSSSDRCNGAEPDGVWLAHGRGLFGNVVMIEPELRVSACVWSRCPSGHSVRDNRQANRTDDQECTQRQAEVQAHECRCDGESAIVKAASAQQGGRVVSSYVVGSSPGADGVSSASASAGVRVAIIAAGRSRCSRSSETSVQP